jgi:hypothetical protein
MGISRQSHAFVCWPAKLGSDVLHEVPKEATYETIEALQDYCVEKLFHVQLKKRNQSSRKSMEFAAVVDHLAHCVHVHIPKISAQKPPVHSTMGARQTMSSTPDTQEDGVALNMGLEVQAADNVERQTKHTKGKSQSSTSEKRDYGRLMCRRWERSG